MKGKLKKIQKKIKSLEDLKPNQSVNKVFTDLVNLATDFKVKDISLKNYFQLVAAEAEVEMEKYWAQKIINSLNPEKTLKEFWYYKNYLDLTKLEFGSLTLCHDHKKHNKVLFVGSGPLPLSGIFLTQLYKCSVTLMDVDEDSLKLSKELCKKLGIKKIKFILSDSTTFTEFEKFDTIFVAAMVENKRMSKENFINFLAKKVKMHTHILVRSVFHNRELLYKKFDITKVKGLNSILEVRPKNGIVNSFHVFEK